jgi:hypothetical protein
MDRETITAESLLRDIYEAESALRWFEQKYGLLSETFYRVYQQGQLRDEDPDEIQEYMEWSGWYEIRQDRRQRYEQAAESSSDGTPHVRQAPIGKGVENHENFPVPKNRD